VGFQLLFSGIITVIEGIYIFLNIINNCKCIKVLKFLVYLSAGAYIIILLRVLHALNLLLLKVPFCFIVAAIYRVFIKFLFKLLQGFERGRVDINN
jgi:hypothetical protein